MLPDLQKESMGENIYPENHTIFLSSCRKSAKKELGSVIIRHCCEAIIMFKEFSSKNPIFGFEFIKALSGFECQLCNIHFEVGAKVVDHIKSPKHEAAYQKYFKEHIGYHDKLIQRNREIVDLLDGNVGREFCLSEKFEDASKDSNCLKNVYILKGDPQFAQVNKAKRTSSMAPRIVPALKESNDNTTVGVSDASLSTIDAIANHTENISCHITQSHGEESAAGQDDFVMRGNGADNSSHLDNRLGRENTAKANDAGELNESRITEECLDQDDDMITQNDVAREHGIQSAATDSGNSADSLGADEGLLSEKNSNISNASTRPKRNSCNNKRNPNIEKHISKTVRSSKKSLECRFCSRTFSQQQGLTRHERIHNGIRPYKCEFCGKRSSDQSTHVKHVRIHTRQKPYVCNTCGKAFSQPGSLITHKRIHTGEKPFKCSICGKAFRQKADVGRHEMLHSGERPYCCEICGSKFNRQFVLNCHKKTHTGEKPHVCNVCGSKFSLHGNLTQHKRIHTGEKPYSCSECGKGFACKSYLKVHQRCHAGEKNFDCEQCGKKFVSTSNLIAHKKTHIPEVS